MAVRKTTLPNIPDPTENNLVEAVRAIKEILEVGQSGRERGDELDAWVTLRDLTEGTTVTDIVSAVVGGGGLTLGGGSRPSNLSQFPGGVDPSSNRLPGRPTNVETQTVWDGIMVKWDWPDPEDPDISWGRAAIWVSGSPDFDQGALQGYSTSNFWVDGNVGLSTPTGETGVRYYWVRFEDFDQVTNELVFTEWSPYKFEVGIKGQAALNTALTVDSFTISCGEGEAINPFVCGDIVTGYDESGNPIVEPGVGLSGQFIVHGSITADQLQAGIIGAELINAEEVWAELANVELLITQGFTTRATLDYRLEINGWGGTKQDFPLWYGRGQTGGEEGLFWFQDFYNEGGDWMWSSFFLSGEMTVTGAGKFFAGTVDRDAEGNVITDGAANRIEIGGPDTGFLLWAGSGVTGTGPDSNPVFFVDNAGNAVFNGTVEAKYVSGEISRTHVIREYEGSNKVWNLATHNYSTYQSLNLDDTKWTTVKEWELGAAPFDNGHIPTILLSYNAYGSGFQVCVARIQIRDLSGGDGNWHTLNGDVVEVNTYGGSFTLTAAAWRMYGKSRFRFQFAKFYGVNNSSSFLRVTHSSRNGYLLGIR
jgi:hypothetical protein